jgi:predicted RNA-binding protein with PUA-like domain
MRCWLIKSEPGVFSIDDLKRDGKTAWTGVRNYQARNSMRDDMRVGDPVLFYYSNAEPSGVAGIARVCSPAHMDATAWDARSEFCDPKAKKNATVWMCVDVEFVEKFPRIVTLDEIRAEPKLSAMLVIKRGMRLSVQPVSAEHFELICGMGRG